jgi:hypothetical protein
MTRTASSEQARCTSSESSEKKGGFIAFSLLGLFRTSSSTPFALTSYLSTDAATLFILQKTN